MASFIYGCNSAVINRVVDNPLDASTLIDTIICEKAQKGNEEYIKKLLDNGTPIEELIKILVSQGSSYPENVVKLLYTKRDEEGNTQLHIGAKDGKLNIFYNFFKLCKNMGALDRYKTIMELLKETNNKGETLFHILAKSAKDSILIFNFILNEILGQASKLGHVVNPNEDIKDILKIVDNFTYVMLDIAAINNNQAFIYYLYCYGYLDIKQLNSTTNCIRLYADKPNQGRDQFLEYITLVLAAQEGDFKTFDDILSRLSKLDEAYNEELCKKLYGDEDSNRAKDIENHPCNKDLHYYVQKALEFLTAKNMQGLTPLDIALQKGYGKAIMESFDNFIPMGIIKEYIPYSFLTVLGDITIGDASGSSSSEVRFGNKRSIGQGQGNLPKSQKLIREGVLFRCTVCRKKFVCCRYLKAYKKSIMDCRLNVQYVIKNSLAIGTVENMKTPI